MTNLDLNQIINYYEDELKTFKEKFRLSMKSHVGLVELVTRYILHQKSKKIRPLLVILSAELCGGVKDRTYRGANLVELLHTATLVHDDVVDSAEERRGFPSINSIWKNKIAVLMGDYLLARGLMLAVEGEDFDFLKVITTTVKRMSEGELLQISKTRRLNNNYETYLRIISDKTASLIATCCEIGARSTTDNMDKVQALIEYGESLGIAFQITDDILDYICKKKLFGKPLGGDIKEKKLTLPLIYALQNCSADEKKDILRIIKKGNEISKVIDFAIKKGGIEYSYKIASEFADKAKKSLEIFDESEVKTHLFYLVDFVVTRNN